MNIESPLWRRCYLHLRWYFLDHRHRDQDEDDDDDNDREFWMTKPNGRLMWEWGESLGKSGILSISINYWRWDCTGISAKCHKLALFNSFHWASSAPCRDQPQIVAEQEWASIESFPTRQWGVGIFGEQQYFAPIWIGARGARESGHWIKWVEVVPTISNPPPISFLVNHLSPTIYIH